MKLRLVAEGERDPFGATRPSVLVSRDTLEALDLDRGDIVYIPRGDTPLSCYISEDLHLDLDPGECATSRTLDRHIENEQSILDIEAGELRRATNAKMGSLIMGSVTMSGSPLIEEDKEELETQLTEKIRNLRGEAYVGQTVEVEHSAPDGTYTASRAIRSLKPGLVAELTGSTDVKILGP